MLLETTEVNHAIVVRDLAKAFIGFSGGGDSFYRAMCIISGVATNIKPEVTLRSPVVRYIKYKDPDLWFRLRPYVKGWK